MVNRQASSASASWRCRALSSCSSAISGATTSRTWCASRRSATGSCSAAQADQVGLGVAAVLDRQRVDTLDDHHRLLLGDAGRRPSRPGPARGRGPARCASSRRRLASRLVCRVGWPSRLPVSAAPGSAPRSRRSAWWAWRSSSSVIWCRSCGQGGQVGLGLGRAQGPQPEVGDLVQLLGDGGDRGRDRVLPGVVECRCHTGNSGIDHRQSRPWNRAFGPACGEVFRDVSGALDVVVSTSSTTGVRRRSRDGAGVFPQPPPHANTWSRRPLVEKRCPAEAPDTRAWPARSRVKPDCDP